MKWRFNVIEIEEDRLQALIASGALDMNDIVFVGNYNAEQRVQRRADMKVIAEIEKQQRKAWTDGLRAIEEIRKTWVEKD